MREVVLHPRETTAEVISSVFFFSFLEILRDCELIGSNYPLN
jgi:hypothetical protein